MRWRCCCARLQQMLRESVFPVELVPSQELTEKRSGQTLELPAAGSVAVDGCARVDMVCHLRRMSIVHLLDQACDRRTTVDLPQTPRVYHYLFISIVACSAAKAISIGSIVGR